MTKWLGWPDAQEYGGHMIKRVTDPDIKVENKFKCQDCHAVASSDSFGVGLRGCPARPASLDYLRIDQAENVESMTLEEQKAEARDHWLDYAKRIGMPVNLETEIVSDNDRPERVMIFSVNGVIYELVYNKQRYSMAAHTIGSLGTVQAAE